MTLEECTATGRTLEDIKNCCTKSTVEARFGCINPPLFEIEPDHIVVDELHLLLRISDRLISALIMRMVQLDHAEHVHHRQSGNHMDQLLAAVRSCGIHFSVS